MRKFDNLCPSGYRRKEEILSYCHWECALKSNRFGNCLCLLLSNQHRIIQDVKEVLSELTVQVRKCVVILNISDFFISCCLELSSRSILGFFSTFYYRPQFNYYYYFTTIKKSYKVNQNQSYLFFYTKLSFKFIWKHFFFSVHKCEL